MKHLLLIPIFVCLIACQSQEEHAKILVAQLGARDARQRVKAYSALVAMETEAIDALIVGLSDDDPQIREMSAWALREIGKPAARIIPALISILADPNENIRVAGSVILQHLGEPAVPYLIDALDAESSEIRLNAGLCVRRNRRTPLIQFCLRSFGHSQTENGMCVVLLCVLWSQ